MLLFTSGHFWGDNGVRVTMFWKLGVAVNTLASAGFKVGIMVEMSTTEAIDDGIGVSVLDGSVADADGKDTTWVIWGVEQEAQTTVMRHNRNVEIFFIIAS